MLVPEAVGSLQLRIEMSETKGYTHFIYLRRGAAGCECYWEATAGGNTLRLENQRSGRRANCTLERDAPVGQSAHDVDRHVKATPDVRLLQIDPFWREGFVPHGGDQLYVGVTLFAAWSSSRWTGF